MHSHDFYVGYRGQPVDPWPIAVSWEARAFSERCNNTHPYGIERCGQRRRLKAGSVYACAECDLTGLWPKRDTPAKEGTP